jgi:hypothetical protein
MMDLGDVGAAYSSDAQSITLAAVVHVHRDDDKKSVIARRRQRRRGDLGNRRDCFVTAFLAMTRIVFSAPVQP